MGMNITELAQSLKAAAEKATPGQWMRSSVQFNCITDIANPMEQGNKPHIANTSERRDAEFIALANPANVIALVEALEKAQTINAAAEKLVRCKGRYHSELNYRALASLFGVTTPDLPPTNDDNVNKVKLPRAYNMLLRQRFFENYSSQDAFKVRDILDALTSAGIKWEES